MARRGFTTELFVEINTLNANPGSGVRLGLQGTVAPGGDAGEQDAASRGSLFHRTDTGDVYKKIGSANTTGDWSKLGDVDIDQLSWRSEKVIAATNDTVSAGIVDPTVFSDNQSGLDGNDFLVGEYLLGDANGVPALFIVTLVTSAASITVAAASQPIANNDTFMVQNYLPDVGAAQEGQAIVHIPLAGSPAVKIADVNWNLADGITLNGYTDSTGAVTGTDTVQVAIQKVEKGLKDVISLTGEARNSINFTAFASPASLLILGTTATIKSAFQRIFDLMAQLRGVEVTGITTAATVDEVPVATVKAVKWLVELHEEATPANRQAFEIYALNNGTTGTDHSLYANLRVGANFNWTANIDVSGGNMRLRMTSSSAGIAVRARRLEVIKNVL